MAFPVWFRNNVSWIDNIHFIVENILDNEIMVIHYDGLDFGQRKYFNIPPGAATLCFKNDDLKYTDLCKIGDIVHEKYDKHLAEKTKDEDTK